MEQRVFGRSGMRFGVLGFGCGAVGGLMVRGDPAEQQRTVARALAAGVNYFDTAVQYGNGESEKNLGRVLQQLKPAAAYVGTKVRLPSGDFGNIAAAVAASLEGSLQRLQRGHVDIFHLHNSITLAGGGDTLSARQVIDEVAPAFDRLRQAGKVRFLGITANGDTEALDQVIDSGLFDSAQVSSNMLTRRRRRHCRPLIRRRTTAACSTIPRPPGSASSASGCWPAARSRAQTSGIRSPARRPTRSAPPAATMPIWPAPGVWRRWSPKALPQASPRRRRGLRCRIRRWARCWSGSPPRGSSKPRSPRSRRGRCRPPRSTASPGSRPALPASRAEPYLPYIGAGLHLSQPSILSMTPGQRSGRSSRDMRQPPSGRRQVA